MNHGRIQNRQQSLLASACSAASLHRILTGQANPTAGGARLHVLHAPPQSLPCPAAEAIRGTGAPLTRPIGRLATDEPRGHGRRSAREGTQAAACRVPASPLGMQAVPQAPCAAPTRCAPPLSRAGSTRQSRRAGAGPGRRRMNCSGWSRTSPGPCASAMQAVPQAPWATPHARASDPLHEGLPTLAPQARPLAYMGPQEPAHGSPQPASPSREPSPRAPPSTLARAPAPSAPSAIARGRLPPLGLELRLEPRRRSLQPREPRPPAAPRPLRLCH
jgi:hypothetical protein